MHKETVVFLSWWCDLFWGECLQENRFFSNLFLCYLAIEKEQTKSTIHKTYFKFSKLVWAILCQELFNTFLKWNFKHSNANLGIITRGCLFLPLENAPTFHPISSRQNNRKSNSHFLGFTTSLLKIQLVLICNWN